MVLGATMVGRQSRWLVLFMTYVFLATGSPVGAASGDNSAHVLGANEELWMRFRVPDTSLATGSNNEAILTLASEFGSQLTVTANGFTRFLAFDLDGVVVDVQRISPIDRWHEVVVTPTVSGATVTIDERHAFTFDLQGRASTVQVHPDNNVDYHEVAVGYGLATWSFAGKPVQSHVAGMGTSIEPHPDSRPNAHGPGHAEITTSSVPGSKAYFDLPGTSELDFDLALRVRVTGGAIHQLPHVVALAGDYWSLNVQQAGLQAHLILGGDVPLVTPGFDASGMVEIRGSARDDQLCVTAPVSACVSADTQGARYEAGDPGDSPTYGTVDYHWIALAQDITYLV